MSLFALPKPIVEMLCTYEAFRKLGFSSDDLSAIGNMRGEVGIELNTQGKSFIVACGIMDMHLTKPKLKKIWRKALSNIDTYSEYDLNKAWKNSHIYHGSQSFVEALINKGFSLPRAWN